MHVGLNLVYLIPGETGGMEVVARELIPALAALGPELRVTAFINREAAATAGPWNDLVPAVTVPVRARNRLEWVRGEQQLLPPLAARAGIDVLHSLASTAPGWGAFRRVVTIHDLIYRLHPQAHFGLLSTGMRVLVPLAARRSHRIVVDSRSTRDDLVRLLRVSSGKIDVVPLGAGSTTLVQPREASEVRAKFELGTRVIALSASAKRPHKNLLRLLEALSLIPAERRPVLVLPGYPTPHEPELRRRVTQLRLEDDVRLLGWLPEEDLEGLYALAGCFLFPSLYEGFGLPVLEAMRRGVPVACSDRPPLTEVAGTAAHYFDPLSPRAMAAAIELLLRDRREADRLRQAGVVQAGRYTWEATARGTVASYRRALRA